MGLEEVTRADPGNCQHGMWNEDHGENGHGCYNCGGDIKVPEECYECALEATSAELRTATRDRHDLRKALSRACTALEKLGRDCKTWRHLIARTDPDRAHEPTTGRTGDPHTTEGGDRD